MKAKWFSTILILAMLVMSFVPAAGAAPGADDGDLMIGANTDNPSHPLGDKQAKLEAKVFEDKVSGKTEGPVKEVAKGQFVELARQGEDSIWTSQRIIFRHLTAVWTIPPFGLPISAAIISWTCFSQRHLAMSQCVISILSSHQIATP
jgi:hypothetical protein